MARKRSGQRKARAARKKAAQEAAAVTWVATALKRAERDWAALGWGARLRRWLVKDRWIKAHAGAIIAGQARATAALAGTRVELAPALLDAAAAAGVPLPIPKGNPKNG